jgi:hypothetical protein
MALVDPDELDGEACSRVYIAGRLREAKHVERVLSAGGIDYFVEIEKFRKHLLGVIPREYDGVAFYVAAAHAGTGRGLLAAAGLRAGLVEDDE